MTFTYCSKFRHVHGWKILQAAGGRGLICSKGLPSSKTGKLPGVLVGVDFDETLEASKIRVIQMGVSRNTVIPKSSIKK